MSGRVMGIDPGLTRCGIGVIDSKPSRKVELVFVETLTSSADDSLESRVGSLGMRIEQLIEELKPSSIAIERVFAQQNLSTVMGVAQISGVVLYLANKYGLTVTFHTPTEVKAAVTGSGKAAKQQVGEMVARILRLDDVPKPADSADSLAIAICGAWRSGAAATDPVNTSAQQKWRDALKSASKPMSS